MVRSMQWLPLQSTANVFDPDTMRADHGMQFMSVSASAPPLGNDKTWAEKPLLTLTGAPANENLSRLAQIGCVVDSQLAITMRPRKVCSCGAPHVLGGTSTHGPRGRAGLTASQGSPPHHHKAPDRAEVLTLCGWPAVSSDDDNRDR